MATREAAGIEEATGIKATLIEGRGGIFDVKLDGVLLYSKHATGRHSEPGEVVRLLEQLPLLKGIRASRQASSSPEQL